MPNRIISIGYLGQKNCYLNISEREAIQRFIKDKGISETEFELNKDVTFNSFEFEDEFVAYDIYAL